MDRFYPEELYFRTSDQPAFGEDIIFTKVSIDQPEGKTYSLQLVFNSEEQQNHFLDEWLPDIEKKIIQIFSNRYLCFSSILTEI